MKKLLLILLGTLIALPALAHDFKYTYEGQTLTYTVIDEDAKTCKTTDGDWWDPGNKVSGELIIPSKAKDGNVEYTVIEIGEFAFQTCSGLTDLSLPEGLASIGNHAFAYCSGLTGNLILPEGLASIGNHAFAYCSGLTGNLILPEGLASIGERAFIDCSGLTDLSLPESISFIGDEAFKGCSGLTSIETSPENPNYTSLDGVLFNKELSTLIQFPGGRTGDYVIPNSVTAIGYYAFYGCNGLTSVTIGNSVTSIGREAFSYCFGLTSVEIPNSVTSIGDYAFTGCSGLISIEVSPENPNYASLDGVLFNKELSTLIQFPGGKTGEYHIPNSVIEIDKYAFSGCNGLTSVEISNSVESIGYGAFEDCSSLTSVYYLADEPIKASSFIFSKSTYENATLYMSEKGISKGRTIDPWKNFAKIKGYDFHEIEYTYGGQTLTYIVIDETAKTCRTRSGVDWKNPGNKVSGELIIPSKAKDDNVEYTVIEIGEYSFSSCRGLTGNLVVPEGLASIGEGAFINCSGLTGNLILPEGLASIGEYAFSGCDGFTGNLVLPEGLASIGERAFSGCDGFTGNLVLPEGLASIGEYAFSGCDGFTGNLVLPESLSSIGEYAFNGCYGLSSVYYGADEPIEGDSDIFSKPVYENATLYMSEKGIVKGRTIDPWKNFAKIEVYVPTDGIEAVDADIDLNQPCEVYSISGAKVGNTTQSLAPGIYIVRQGNAVKKIAVK